MEETSSLELNGLIPRVVGLIDGLFVVLPGPDLAGFEVLHGGGEVGFIEGFGQDGLLKLISECPILMAVIYSKHKTK